MLIVGSVAAAHYFDIGRVPKDIDVVVSEANAEETIATVKKEFNYHSVEKTPSKAIVFGDKIVEIEIAKPSSAMGKLLPELEYGIAPLWLLYALKLSHRYSKNSSHFLKTMHDIHQMRKVVPRLTDAQHEWMLERQRETLSYAHPNLNRNKSEFFGADTERYYYEHDRLHEAVAVGDVPAYLSYKAPDQEVLWDPEMFFKQPHRVRMHGVVEEARVLAYERAIVPLGVAPERAYRMALQKVCTSITSGRFREYAWENYQEALQRGMLTPSVHAEILLQIKTLPAAHPSAKNCLLNL